MLNVTTTVRSDSGAKWFRRAVLTWVKWSCCRRLSGTLRGASRSRLLPYYCLNSYCCSRWYSSGSLICGWTCRSGCGAASSEDRASGGGRRGATMMDRRWCRPSTTSMTSASESTRPVRIRGRQMQFFGAIYAPSFPWPGSE